MEALHLARAQQWDRVVTTKDFENRFSMYQTGELKPFISSIGDDIAPFVV